jgi:hypothetical protein
MIDTVSLLQTIQKIPISKTIHSYPSSKTTQKMVEGEPPPLPAPHLLPFDLVFSYFFNYIIQGHAVQFISNMKGAPHRGH